MGTCISDCTVCIMPPALKADCTGTLTMAGALWVMVAAGATTIGLGGLGASTE